MLFFPDDGVGAENFCANFTNAHPSVATRLYQSLLSFKRYKALFFPRYEC